MVIFKNKPKFRFIFVISYICLSIWIIIKDFAPYNFLATLPLLFMVYVSLVKSKIISKPRVEKISDFAFDVFSIIISLYLVVDVLIYFIL